MASQHADFLKTLGEKKSFDDDLKKQLTDAIKDFKTQFLQGLKDKKTDGPTDQQAQTTQASAMVGNK